MTDKDKGLRRVYVLPSELVARIVEYQDRMGLGSEVEAARRLLDDALKNRDTYKTLITKFLDAYDQNNMLSEAARDVLAGHPLVTSIQFEDREIRFSMKEGLAISIDYDRDWWVRDTSGKSIERSKVGTKGRESVQNFDDIPF